MVEPLENATKPDGWKINWGKYAAVQLLIVLIAAIVALISSDACYNEWNISLFYPSLSYPFVTTFLLAAFLFKKKAPLNNFVIVPFNLALTLTIFFFLGMLGYAPPLCDAEIPRSYSYWRGEARPFAILKTQFYRGGSSIKFMIQNADTRNLTIQKIHVGNSTKVLDLTFEPEQITNITMKLEPFEYSVEDNVYRLNVAITYITPDGQETVFVGAKPIVGKYA